MPAKRWAEASGAIQIELARRLLGRMAFQAVTLQQGVRLLAVFIGQAIKCGIIGEAQGIAERTPNTTSAQKRETGKRFGLWLGRDLSCKLMRCSCGVDDY